MERSVRTVSAIKALGYPGSSCVSRCECDELPCPLLTWLSANLRTLCPELQAGSSEVLLVEELRNLLSDMFSPLAVVTADVLEPLILNNITEFLLSELLAARIIKHKDMHPEENLTGGESVKEQRVEDQSCEFCQDYEHGDIEDSGDKTAEMQAEWILLLRSLGLDASSQFGETQTEVKSRIDRLLGGDMKNPLLTASLSSDQWVEVKKINQILSEDYGCRRQMMIKRFQVTLESFAWGDKQKERRAALASVPPLASLAGGFQVSLSHLLAAREDQSFIEPIKAGKSTPVYKTLMGSVPDRGGRPGEIEPPMPTWEQRRTHGNRGGRGRGGGGGGGGGGGHHQRHKKKKGKKE